MRGVGWFSDTSQLWCNYFTNLVWKEAYAEVGAKEPTVKQINSTVFKNFNNNYNPKSPEDLENFINRLDLSSPKSKKTFVTDSNLKAGKEFVMLKDSIRPDMRQEKIQNAYAI